MGIVDNFMGELWVIVIVSSSMLVKLEKFKGRLASLTKLM